MAKKYPKSEAIQNAQPIIKEEAYVTWGDDFASKVDALAKSSESLDEYSGILRSKAAPLYLRTDFSNILPNISSRPGLTRTDYDYFRPQESVPGTLKTIMSRADEIYQKIGLVKNVIDLMGDFSSQGIRISHPNKRIERFYRNWFKKIKGKDRSERFLNNLYRTGNIVINRQTAKISLKTSEHMYRSSGSVDLTDSMILQEEILVEKREIPWKYTFIDPLYVNVVAGALSSFVQQKIYNLTVPPYLRKIINGPRNEQERQIIAKLPPQIIEAAKEKKPYPLDPNKTIVFHYKKDDWQSWAYPIIYAIMDDITVLEKLKLADIAALDGAISNIRVFKLGNLEHKIAPTKAAAAKLASILQNNVGGGTMDIVWGPDLELVESNSTIHNFLGEGKYTPHLNNVYAGLGIPPTLTGTYGAAGTTNNFISLKTLTQRLQYGRDVLVQFWDQEINMVQKAMGFRYPAKIEFDRMDLSNEDSEKALLIQLADRNVISDELLQKRFGADPDMERVRLNREARDREGNRMVSRLGPFNDIEDDMKKIVLQLGMVAPSEVGLELLEKKKNEKTLLDIKNAQEMKKIKETPEKTVLPTGIPPTKDVPGKGRPVNKKDSQKRKVKKFAPQTGASLILWASQAQEKISEYLNPSLLEFYNKKNMRSLSQEEYKETENFKTKILFLLSPFVDLTQEIISGVVANIDDHPELHILYNRFIKTLSSSFDRPMVAEEYKQAKSYFYSSAYSTEDESL